jgi:hypothetical protein
LQRIRELVRAGATVVGPRPQHSPSLADFPKCDAQVKKLADELWGKCDGSQRPGKFRGKGRIVWGKSLADVFAAQNLKPDFEFHGDSDATHLAYAHRVAGEADIYFVSNQRRQFDSAECTFRVSGKVPELWHPDTGVIEPAPVWSAQDGRTTVRLDFEPAGSVFVIFRHAADSADHVVAVSGNGSTESSAHRNWKFSTRFTPPPTARGMDVTAKLSNWCATASLSLRQTTSFFGAIRR